MFRRLLTVLLLPLSASVWSADSGLVPVPALTARVTDLTQTLTPQQSMALEQKLAVFEQQKGSQIAVLIVPTTQPEEIEQYSIRVVDAWKLGRAKVDDGALLIIAKNDRRMRIEVGRGLEGALPDAIAKRIIAEIITPRFRQGDFFGGIEAGVSQMMSVVQGEPLPPPQRQQGRGGDRLTQLLAPFFIFWFIGSALRRAIGTFPTAALVGAGTGFAGSFLLGSALLGGGLGIVALILAFILYSGGNGGGTYYGGGGFGGGGFGGGSFGGGFGGGGGGFSGGGSSGSW